MPAESPSDLADRLARLEHWAEQSSAASKLNIKNLGQGILTNEAHLMVLQRALRMVLREVGKPFEIEVYYEEFEQVRHSPVSLRAWLTLLSVEEAIALVRDDKKRAFEGDAGSEAVVVFGGDYGQG